MPEPAAPPPGPGLTVEELVERLSAGEDLGSIARSRLPPSERELLRRCAAVRAFDQELFDGPLTVGLEEAGLSIDGLAAAGQIEPVPGADGRWRIRGSLRAGWFRAWWPDPADPDEAHLAALADPDEPPAALRAFTANLVEHYREAGDQVEVLHHLGLIDPAAAQVLLRRLFDAADRRFDLATCQDVLDAVSGPERDPHIGVDLAELRNDRQLYLGARTHWSSEWYQSARFLERPALRDLLTGLLDGEIDGAPGRALQLAARGGMGKTMQLRWFIARWCIPAPRRIPCARVDFDVAEPATASTHPFLVLLGLADQLNRQLTGAPFEELLAEHGRYLSLLRRRPTPEAQAAASLLDSGDRAAIVARDVTYRFTATLNGVAGTTGAAKPVVLILDTLEEVLLHPAGDVDALLAVLAEVHDACPAVRLILSGRYDLTEPGRVASLAGRLPDLVTRRVVEFDEDERRAYLTTTRGIDRPELVEALASKSGGLPFTLALLADLALARPDLDPAEVEGYDDPGVLYLIERVVSRIDDPKVRWLLRYGVVPRRLALGFVDDVMRPHLAAGMAGTSTVDDPGADHPDADRPGPARRPAGLAAQHFPTDALAAEDAPLDLHALWARLRRYASSYSWVGLHAEDPGMLVFHPDVVEPMRRLLRRHDVYRLLHRDAVAWHERRAAANPDAWLAYAKEAVYHAFQADGPAAGARWLNLLDEAERRGGLDWRGQLAAELLRPEYVDERGDSRPWDGTTPMLTWTLLGQANAEEAAAIVAAATDEGGLRAAHPLFGRARQRMARARAIQAAGNWPDAPEVDLALTEAALLLADDESGAAERLLTAALERAAHPAERVGVLEALADLLTGTRPLDAIDRYREALGLAAELPEGEAEPARLRLASRLAALLADRDVLDEAIRVARIATELSAAGGEPDADLVRAEIDIRRRAGVPTSALAVFPEGSLPDDVVGSIHLAAGRPAAAWIRLREPDASLVGQVEALGDALALLLDVGPAEEGFEAAARSWEQRGEPELASLSMARAARLHLRATGDLRRVEGFLDGAIGLRPKPGGEAWLLTRLHRVEQLAARGTPGWRLLDETVEILDEVGAAPRHHVRAAIEGLALLAGAAAVRDAGSRRPEAELVTLLCTHLDRVTPWSARVAVLDELWRCPPLTDPHAKHAVALHRIVEDQPDGLVPSPGGLGGAEHGLRLLTVAEVCRVLGRPSDAVALLREGDAALGSPAGTDGGYGCYLWLMAANRLVRNWPGSLGEVLTAVLTAAPRAGLNTRAEALAAWPALGGALLVELADLRLTVDTREATAERLARAATLLTEAGHVTADGRAATTLGARLRELEGRAAARAGDRSGADAGRLAAIRAWEALGQQARASALHAAEEPVTTDRPIPPVGGSGTGDASRPRPDPQPPGRPGGSEPERPSGQPQQPGQPGYGPEHVRQGDSRRYPPGGQGTVLRTPTQEWSRPGTGTDARGSRWRRRAAGALVAALGVLGVLALVATLLLTAENGRPPDNATNSTQPVDTTGTGTTGSTGPPTTGSTGPTPPALRNGIAAAGLLVVGLVLLLVVLAPTRMGRRVTPEEDGGGGSGAKEPVDTDPLHADGTPVPVPVGGEAEAPAEEDDEQDRPEDVGAEPEPVGPSRAYVTLSAPEGSTLRTLASAPPPDLPPGRAPVRQREVPLQPVADVDLFRQGDLLAFRDLMGLVAKEPAAAATLLAGLLPPAEPEGGTPGGGGDDAELWLQTDDALLAMLPWELVGTAGAAGAGGRTRWVQRWRRPLAPQRELALAARRALHRLAGTASGTRVEDPLEDPAFQAALADFRRRHQVEEGQLLGPATFAALRRAEAAGIPPTPGRRPAVLYLRAVGDTADVDDVATGVAGDVWPRPATMRDIGSSGGDSLWEAVAALARRDAPVRAIVASGTFTRPYARASLRLGGTDARSGARAKSADVKKAADPGVELSAADLDRAIAGLPSPVERPLVVLDADGPVGASEAARQLLLRNAFAHELFALGNVTAVVALGVETVPLVRPRFLRALADGGAVADALAALRVAPPPPSTLGGLPPGVAANAVALWSNLPGYALPRIEVEP